MSLEPQAQFKNILEKSKEILILVPENPSGDALGSAFALYFFLKNKGIGPSLALPRPIGAKYDFLPRPEKILTEISGARDFVLSFETSYNKIVGIRHEEEGSKFNIYLTPEKGSIDPRDFSFILAKFKYDLVIALDSPDLEKLGKIYENNADLFFEVPVVNIDHHSNNENFGQINLVDITASSCGEILAGLLEQIAPALITKPVADGLLTGIISATDSFQKRNTTPKALLAAANLMDKGADQQEIVRWLYKTQPLHILKLWGRAMAKLNWDEKDKLIWADLTVEDFVQSRSNPTDLPAILEKLQENYSEGRIFMAIYNDTPTSAVALIKSAQPEILQRIHRAIESNLNQDILETRVNLSNLAEAGELISKKIKEHGIQ